MDTFTERIRLTLARLDHAVSQDWSRGQGLATSYAILCGTGAALLQARAMLDRWLAEADRLPAARWKDHKPPVLGAWIMEAHDGHGVDWGATPDLANWALGYFLNKAEANIAAALDRAVAATLYKVLGVEISPPETARPPRPDAESFFYGWPPARWRILAVLFKETELGAMCDALFSEPPRGDAGRFGAYAAADEVRRAARPIATWSSSSGEVLESAMANQARVVGPRALSIVVNRVDAFKHIPAGTLDRRAEDYVAEIVITLDAFEYVTQIWLAMLAHDRSGTKENSSPP